MRMLRDTGYGSDWGAPGSDEARLPLRQFDAALSNVESGIALWDTADRLILANRKVADLFGVAEETLVPGLPFPEFIRLVVESGYLEGRDIDEVYELAISLARR